MSTGGLTPRDREELQVLEGLMNRVRHGHGLVERFAAEITNPEPHAIALRRLFGQLKLQMSGAGLDTLSQTCGALEMAARRGGSHVAKTRILRDGIASLRQQIELAQRAVRMNRQREAGEQEKADASGAQEPAVE